MYFSKSNFGYVIKSIIVFLGKGWENHIEGQKLKGDGDSFRLKLNTQEVFDDWARKVLFFFTNEYYLKVNEIFN